MAALDLSGQGLTDSSLTQKLDGLPDTESFTKVDLRNNSLDTVQNLNAYKQFESLELLYLSQNNIGTVEPEKIPRHVKVLLMPINNISELGDFSQHQNLETLWVWENKIKSIDPSKLPLNIKELLAWNNELTEIGDLVHHHRLGKLNITENKLTQIDPSKIPVNIQVLEVSDNRLTEVGDFSRHKQLVELFLAGNELVHIHAANTNISSWDMDTFGEKFFQNEDGYNNLKRYNFDSTKLMQPPREVFDAGLKSIQSYFKSVAQSKRVMQSDEREEDLKRRKLDEEAGQTQQSTPSFVQTSALQADGGTPEGSSQPCTSRYIPLKYNLLKELTEDQKKSCPSEDFFEDIVANFESVYFLGIYLGISFQETEEIVARSPKSLREQLLNVLAEWKKNKGAKATFQRLIKAMEKCRVPEDCAKEAVLKYFKGHDSAGN